MPKYESQNECKPSNSEAEKREREVGGDRESRVWCVKRRKDHTHSTHSLPLPSLSLSFCLANTFIHPLTNVQPTVTFALWLSLSHKNTHFHIHTHTHTRSLTGAPLAFVGTSSCRRCCCCCCCCCCCPSSIVVLCLLLSCFDSRATR